MKELELAGRWTRLGAALIDGILSIVVTLPFMGMFGIMDKIDVNGMLPFSTTLLLSAIGLLIFLLLHGYFLANYGQTIGKKILDIKIVNLDGEKPDFASLITKRYLPIWAISLIPVIGNLIALADALFIFRKDRRCIHDMIAGTKVVENTTIHLGKKSAENPFK